MAVTIMNRIRQIEGKRSVIGRGPRFSAINEGLRGMTTFIVSILKIILTQVTLFLNV